MKKLSSFLVVLLLMLASFTAGIEYPRGDVSQDGQVNISDVSVLIDYLLTGTWDDEPVNHEYVDLGLPSGTLWATCNVGANNPEEYGDYFAWGETEPKDVYNEYNYKWYISHQYAPDTLTKYNTVSYLGQVDYKTELDLEDDAAYVNWGPSWRMPSETQLEELLDNCTWTWTTMNNFKGYSVTGPNGNTMFLPAAGIRLDSSLNYTDMDGYYWSRTLYTRNPLHGCSITILQDSHLWDFAARFDGLSVRAVRVSQN